MTSTEQQGGWPLRLILLTLGGALWLIGATVTDPGVFATFLTTIGHALMVGGAVGIAVTGRP